ncbi:MAG: DUF4833 domain-containing protein [Endomicrobium sp.]|jgi:hypothetical protein|nr:DUF4833 domain-containing protein [Endomicrobium sp.]
MKKNVVIFIVAGLFINSIASSQIVKRNLFTIERNKNANVVMYDVRLNNDGSIDKFNPIDVYWILYAKHGQREEITALERRAYGIKLVNGNNSSTDYNLTLRAIPDRMIRLTIKQDKPRAEIKINNKEAYLSTVYVFAKDGLIPKILYYVLTGIEIKTGMKVSEKITPR